MALHFTQMLKSDWPIFAKLIARQSRAGVDYFRTLAFIATPPLLSGHGLPNGGATLPFRSARFTVIDSPLRSISARISAISTYLPETVLSNRELAAVFDTWSEEKILEKTGIAARRIAAPDETALDLGTAAADKLLTDHSIDRSSIDFLLFCTQAPDYLLPTSACIMQHRLGLAKSVGALDINLGCSGYVYGLSLAAGLISGGMAKRILFVTADTYSKFINSQDRSVRTLFGDGATATLIEVAEQLDNASIGPFVFGTDGSGAKDLIVESGGARMPRSHDSAVVHQDEFGNMRSADNLFMNGSAVMSFTLREVPRMLADLRLRADIGEDDVDLYVLHQANRFMLDALVKKMKIPAEKAPYFFENVGNTVSSTIPFVLNNLMETRKIRSGSTAMLLGFGVGLSWGGALVRF
jgi:3-oxoacyl-[acyl-carrier-protein] synthase III